MNQIVQKAKHNKSINTLFNRRRLFPEFESIDMAQIKRCERQAVNSVIQGTAADLVKRAMIQVDQLFSTHPACSKSKLILQIHDELVFEIDNDSLDTVLPLIKNTMEKAIQLCVAIPVSAYDSIFLQNLFFAMFSPISFLVLLGKIGAR